MLMEVLLTVLFVLVYWKWKINGRKKGESFPGPWRLPIIGNLHQILRTNENESFAAMHLVAKPYSSIVSLKLGTQEIVHLSDYEEIVALLSREEVADRVFIETIRARSWNEPLGIVFGNGEEWKEVRRFTIRTLRDFGFGKRFSMESSMLWEMGVLMERLRKQMSLSEGRIHVEMLFTHSLMNVSWTMIAGNRYSYDDPRMTRLLTVTAEAMSSGSFGADLGFMFPILLRILPCVTKAKPLGVFFNESQQFLQEILDEHRKKDYAVDPDCVVDVFLRKIEEDEAEGRKIFTEKQLLTVLLDLFLTASDTLGGALTYALLYMTLNPKSQEKVHEEIDRVISSTEEVSFTHKSKMVYTQATLLESLRLGVVAALVPARQVNRSFDYKGYHFHKGMAVIANVYSVFQDARYFENPGEFRPERFIDADGKLFKAERIGLAFGAGKRFCMGEPLAQASLFLFFTTFMKNFKILKVPNEPNPSEESLPAFTRTPKPFDVILVDRMAKSQ